MSYRLGKKKEEQLRICVVKTVQRTIEFNSGEVSITYMEESYSKHPDWPDAKDFHYTERVRESDFSWSSNTPDYLRVIESNGTIIIIPWSHIKKVTYNVVNDKV